MKNSDRSNQNLPECNHKNMIQEGGSVVCKDCGLILEEGITFEKGMPVTTFYKDSQREYERTIRIKDSRAIQDPTIKQKYDKIKTLDIWYRDAQSSFGQQNQTIELLKSYGIGLNIDNAKYQEIKERYLSFNKKHRKTYQNMVIIFLAIVWMKIKETTSVRIERFIEVCVELGHKINKKMLNNAMLKVKKTEKKWQKKFKTPEKLEKEIKNKIKILFQKDLNNITHESVKENVYYESKYYKIKIEMQLLAGKLLDMIPYEKIRNLNYKAFTAGLIYYVGQCLPNRKIFTQSLLEKTTNFSSTTIRKKFHMLKDILGEPQEFRFRLGN